MIWNLILIQIIVVFIVDLSGAIESIKHAIWRWLKPNHAYRDFPFKPFECSLCSYWWISLIYLICTHSFTLPYIAITAILSFLTSTTKDILITVKEIITSIIIKINDKL